MFLSEARLAARLHHPNIVQTNEVIEVDGAPVLVMEYLDGQPLSQVIMRGKQGGFSLAMQLRVLVDALAGLHAAHELADFDGTPLGVVHRDVSPHNLFVTLEGQAKVLDFGIAKLERSMVETEVGTVKGKLRYMAPEQIRGDKLDRRADIYAAGVILWEALTGERMWKVSAEGEIRARVLGATCRCPRRCGRTCRRRWRASAAGRWRARPSDRYATARQLADELEAAMPELGLAASHREIGATVARLFDDVRARDQARRSSQARARVDGDADPGGAPAPARRRTGAAAAARRRGARLALGCRRGRRADRGGRIRGVAARAYAAAPRRVGASPAAAPAPIRARPAAAPTRTREASLTPRRRPVIAPRDARRAPAPRCAAPPMRAGEGDDAPAGTERAARAESPAAPPAPRRRRAGARPPTARPLSSSTPTDKEVPPGVHVSDWQTLISSRRARCSRHRRGPPQPRRPAKAPRRQRGDPPSARAQRRRADPAKAECFARHEEAQVARRQGHLLEARAWLRQCSSATCIGIVRADCIEWLAEVERAIPSVVITARARGADLVDVKVIIDKQPVTARLTGAALDVDPGAPSSASNRRRGPPIERTILVSEGVKDRPIDVEFAPPRRRALPRGPSRSRSAPPIRLRAGRHRGGGWPPSTTSAPGPLDAQQLETACAPFCRSEDANAVRTKLIVADVGTGIVSFRCSSACTCTARGAFRWRDRRSTGVTVWASTAALVLAVGVRCWSSSTGSRNALRAKREGLPGAAASA